MTFIFIDSPPLIEDTKRVTTKKIFKQVFKRIFQLCSIQEDCNMELVIDVKIEVKSSSYRNVITDFGYFKKITGESVSKLVSFLIVRQLLI